MKKTVFVGILLVVSVLTFQSLAFCGSPVAGTWNGTIASVALTSATEAQCSSGPITLTIVQCDTTSNLIRGTLWSMAFVGKFRSDGTTFDLTFPADAYTSLSFTGQYISGKSAHINILDMEYTYIDMSTYIVYTIIYGNCTLTR